MVLRALTSTTLVLLLAHSTAAQSDHLRQRATLPYELQNRARDRQWHRDQHRYAYATLPAGGAASVPDDGAAVGN